MEISLRPFHVKSQEEIAVLVQEMHALSRFKAALKPLWGLSEPV